MQFQTHSSSKKHEQCEAAQALRSAAGQITTLGGTFLEHVLTNAIMEWPHPAILEERMDLGTTHSMTHRLFLHQIQEQANFNIEHTIDEIYMLKVKCNAAQLELQGVTEQNPIRSIVETQRCLQFIEFRVCEP